MEDFRVVQKRLKRPELAFQMRAEAIRAFLSAGMSIESADKCEQVLFQTWPSAEYVRHASELATTAYNNETIRKASAATAGRLPFLSVDEKLRGTEIEQHFEHKKRERERQEAVLQGKSKSTALDKMRTDIKSKFVRECPRCGASDDFLILTDKQLRSGDEQTDVFLECKLCHFRKKLKDGI